jgi:hypothetical protein
MWFKKNPTPAAPSPERQEEFVKWLLRYSDDLESLRRPYRKNLDGFVEVNWKSINKEINEQNLTSADALMMRGGKIAKFYEENFMRLVDERGGIAGCPPGLQANAVMMLVKISVMLYLAKHRYGAPIPEDLLGMTKI